jgi:hypothetical protein
MATISELSQISLPGGEGDLEDMGWDGASRGDLEGLVGWDGEDFVGF